MPAVSRLRNARVGNLPGGNLPGGNGAGGNLAAVLRSRDGAAALEFAMVAAVLLPMLFGLLAFSTTLFAMTSMQSGAAEAARRVAVGAVTYAASVTCASNPAAGTAAKTACQLVPAWGTYTVAVTVNCGTKDVTVTMTNNSSIALGDVYSVITGANYTTRAVTRWEGITCP